MKTTEIIAINPINDVSSRKFKNPHLTEATNRITAIYNDAAKYADAKNREIAKILGEVASKKSYEIDGFKSVADYAASVFGIARQNAYSLANAGKVYNDPKSHPELKAMSPSKIAEVSTVAPAALKEALDSGKISHTTTQKDLREFAENSKSTGAVKSEVVDTFTARICATLINERDADTLKCNKTIEEWDEWFTVYISTVSPSSPVEIVKLPKGKLDSKSEKATINRRLYFNRDTSLVVEFFKYVAPKPSTSKPKFTKEQLLAMLAEMEETANK